mmetsp:Transcript_10530/g.16167  ORF Transcript_10530/g.16167 Transcript_10530/m.16167 type:complete len:606 (+) Transcript_10530:42-1859(+)
MMHRRGHNSSTGNGTASTDGSIPTSNGNGVAASRKQGRVTTPTPTASTTIPNGGTSASSASSLLDQRKTNRIRRRRRKKQSKSAFSTYYGQHTNYDPGSIMQLFFVGVMLLVILFFGLRNFLSSSSSATSLSSSSSDEGESQNKPFLPKLRKQNHDGNEGAPFHPHPHRKSSTKQHRNGWLQGMFQKEGPSFYDIPGAMKDIGDKTMEYAKLRKEFDELLPRNDFERQQQLVESLKPDRYDPIPQDSYNIHDCPFDPPRHYPFAWNIMDILENWPPDDPKPRPDIYQALCVFDHEVDYDKAMNYRKKEVPFIVQNDPDVLTTVERWNTPTYMDRLLSDVKYRTEFSINNHFMYWVPPRKKKNNKHGRHQQDKSSPFKSQNNADKTKKKDRLNWKHNVVQKPNNWTAPTQMMRMPYKEWLEHANVTDDNLGPDKPHWYYRLIGCGAQGSCDKDSSEFLFDELKFFQPRESLYMVQPEKQKGIHCRFGMKGVIAENHFDGSRNFIVVLGGSRRYILSHPNQCKNLALLPKEHPSGRHSAVDWSNPDLENYPEFQKAEANEVVLQAGDALYLPTNWFHYIISLELNFQCNTRSGTSGEYMPPIHDCGF